MGAKHVESAGAPLELSSAADIEQLVRARGTLFLVTNASGDVFPKGARELGLFAHDTRYLSLLSLRVADADLVHLSSDRHRDAFNQVDLMLSGRGGEFLDDPQNYVHIRRRQLLDDSFIEELTFTNYLERPVTVRLELQFAADFADIFEVRGAKRAVRGDLLEPKVTADQVVLAYQGRDHVRYESTLEFSPAPSDLSANGARYQLDIASGDCTRLYVSVTPRSSMTQPVGHHVTFAARADKLEREAHSFRRSCTQIRCSNEMVQHVLDQSVMDLSSLQLELEPASIIAAGIPWFCVPFGRDSLITSYAAALLNPCFGKESLRVLAAYQGKKYDDVTEEEPGKIFHELRFGEMARAHETPHTPYYGTIDATPLFVVVADAVYRATGDREWLEELAPAIEAALAWIDVQSQEGRQLVSYARKSAGGLDNQGWKDSKAAVVTPEGRRAEPPIALCEIQGYCVDAYLRGAELLDVLNKRDVAERYRARGRAMRAFVQETLWLPKVGRYAYAVDGTGEKFETIVSNLGHLLWSRVPTDEHAKAIGDLLLSPASFSGYGVRTLASSQGAYNPLSYHNGTVWPHDNALIVKGLAQYGLQTQAVAMFDGLLAAMSHFRDHRLPELFCGLPREDGNLVRYPVACSPQAWAAATPFLLLQSVLGIEFDAPQRRLSIERPYLPAAIEWVELDNLHVGQSRVHIRFKRDSDGKANIERLDVTGAHLRVEVGAN